MATASSTIFLKAPLHEPFFLIRSSLSLLSFLGQPFAIQGQPWKGFFFSTKGGRVKFLWLKKKIFKNKRKERREIFFNNENKFTVAHSFLTPPSFSQVRDKPRVENYQRARPSILRPSDVYFRSFCLSLYPLGPEDPAECTEIFQN